MKYFIVGYLSIRNGNLGGGTMDITTETYPRLQQITDKLKEDNLGLISITFINELTEDEFDVFNIRSRDETIA